VNADIWELFSKAQHLHFERGDILALTTKQPLPVETIDRLREELNKVSDGVIIMCVDPGIEISRETADVA
jgi:hypothetical protein